MTRRILMPTVGRFVRYYDLFTNTSAFAQDVPVALWTRPDLSQQTDADVTPSATTPGYFVRSETVQGALAFGSVYAGVDPPVAMTRQVSADLTTVEATTTLQLAPGQSVALLHYVLLRAPDSAGQAVTDADALATLTDPDVFLGLSQTDLGLIVNFRVP